jgi:hypothetical protein
MVIKDFKVGEHVFLKVKAKISSLRLSCCTKLEAIYYGPFEILEKIGLVAYMLEFLASMRVHNVFHVSLLNKYVPDPNHIIYWTVIQLEYEGDFRVEPMRICCGKFSPAGQVKPPLDQDSFDPRQKETNGFLLSP